MHTNKMSIGDNYLLTLSMSFMHRSLILSNTKEKLKVLSHLQLREEFDTGQEVWLNEECCPHDVATLLKEFFRDLPEPLLTRELYEPLIKTQSKGFTLKQSTISDKYTFSIVIQMQQLFSSLLRPLFIPFGCAVHHQELMMYSSILKDI